MADKKKKKEELETGMLEDVEIFREGRWNGDLYTAKDLSDIVDSFKEINHRVQAFFKLDHPEENIGGMPAIGWLKDVRHVGTKLMATITDVPVRIIELIKAKAFKRISSEVYWNYTDPTSGEKFRRVLKAAALLGAVTPAVDTLEDVEALYHAETLVYRDERGEVHVCRTYEVEKKEDEMEWEKMYKEEKEAREKLVTRVADLEKTLGEKDDAIKKLETEKKEETTAKEGVETKLEKQRTDGIKNHVKEYIKKAVEERRITPKLGKKVTPLMEELALSKSTHKYETEDGKEAEETMLQLFETVIGAIPTTGTPIGEDAGKDGPSGTVKDYSKTEDGQLQERGDIAARAEEIAKEQKIELGPATELALEEARK